MTDTAPRRRLRAAAAALPLILAPLTAPGAAAAPGDSAMWTPAPAESAAPAPIRETDQDLAGLPAGVRVAKVQWLTERHVKLLIDSAAMPGAPVAVELLLPRDFHRDPGRTFPVVWHLDGMRAREDYSGWTLETTIDRFYGDKNVLVVLPVGGEASFYSDWDAPEGERHYKWETFLVEELIPVLREGWRAGEERAVVGLSMGGTAAVNLAEHHPGLFDFVGSFSGYLDTTSPGMPRAIAAAMREAGDHDAAKMWGPPGSRRWREHDPKLGVDRLRGTTVYVSAGNGNTGQWDEPGEVAPNMPANTAGWGLELLSRMTSETFVQAARRAEVPVEVSFRESGTHSWPYWQFETTQAWPHLADALRLPEGDRGVTCAVGGAIAAKIAELDGVGDCLSDEYPVGAGGVAQDFANGRAYFHPDTGANVLWGRIGARYAEIGGPDSPLGFPTTSERATPDGAGRYVHFTGGSIYWTPGTGAHVVGADFANAWGDSGWEAGPLGYPVGERREVAGGAAQDFQRGMLTRAGDGEVRLVAGAIAERYRDAGGPDGELGHPAGGEEALRDGGALQRFEHGIIYHHPEHGAHIVPAGDIFDHWGGAGWENGPFGYPVGEQRRIPAGGLEQEFAGGWIRQLNGRIEEERR